MKKTNLLALIVLSFCVATQPLFAVANTPKITIMIQDEQAKKELALKQRIEKALEAIRQIEALCPPKIAKLNQELFAAIEANNAKEAARLIRTGAQVNAHAKENSFTPLMKAIEQGNEEIIKLLLKNGADVNAEIPISIGRDQASFTTPLLVAIEKSNLGLCRLLVAWGAHVLIEHLEKAHDNKEIFLLLCGYYDITIFKKKLAITGIILAFSAAVFGILFGIEAVYNSIRHKMNPTGQRIESVVIPDEEPARSNNVPIAEEPPMCPLLRLNAIPNLAGFYHMRSNVVGLEDLPASCGFHTLMNMLEVDQRVHGRRLGPLGLAEIIFGVVPDVAEKWRDNIGIPMGAVGQMAARLRLSPTIQIDAIDDRHIIAPMENVNRMAQEFRAANEPRVVHFICGIPRHVFAISVVRFANGNQGMYLYDNLNEQPIHINLMRRIITYIYNRFF